MVTAQQTVFSAGIPLGVTCHRPSPEQNRRSAVLYFHGGGLFYGERDDLPEIYREAFLSAGYTLFCFDYPLAPETPLSGIHRAVLDCAKWFLSEECAQNEFSSYFLFGRSAGAYLALILSKQLHGFAEFPAPAGILDFYGYYDLHDAFFSMPCRYYEGLPAVSNAVADKLISDSPITAGPKALRFSLYVYARQTCGWLRLLGAGGQDLDLFSLSPEDIAHLPPLFITASSGDQDIPMRISKTLSRTAPTVRSKWIYYLEHDFDRDVQNPAGMSTYQNCLSWMEEICDHLPSAICSGK